METQIFETINHGTTTKRKQEAKGARYLITVTYSNDFALIGSRTNISKISFFFFFLSFFGKIFFGRRNPVAGELYLMKVSAQ